MDVMTFEDIKGEDATTVGAKAATLADLRRAGFDVPDGIVLPAGEALRARAGGIAGFAAQAAARFPGPVAVRSSGTREDHATSARAGMGHTELGPEGEAEIAAAITRCLDHSGDRVGNVAILVMPLLDPSHAGVAFSADPTTGDRDIVRLAATTGLADQLVQGEVVGIDVTVRGAAINGDLAGFPPADALAVADLARRVEQHLGAPQDIEWAIEDGRLWLLQARPITVLPIEPDLPQGNNWQKDVAHYPEPLTAFGWSVMASTEDDIAAVFDEVGMLIRGVENEFVGGEIYSRVRPAFGSANAAAPPPPAPVLGVAARLVPELRRRTKVAAATLRTGQFERWEQDWHSRVRQELLDEVDDLAARDPRDLSDDALVEHHGRCQSLARRGMQVHFRLFMPYVQGLHALHRLVGDALGWDDGRIAGMLAGHSPATREPADAMEAVRRRVAGVPGALDAVEAQPHDPVGALEAVDPALADALRHWMHEHGWAAINYDAGRPTIAERPATVASLLLAEPDDDESTAEQAADAIAVEARAALHADQRGAFDEALAVARRVQPLREDNTIVAGDRPFALLRRWMLEVARRLEDRGVLGAAADAPHLTQDELRDALTGRLGRAEVATLVQRRRGEEAWVRARPGPAFIGAQAPPPDVSRLPEALRTVNEPVLWMVGHEYPSVRDGAGDGPVIAVGVPASPGTVEGPARVIRSHDEIDRIRPGDVLVCQVTTPAWAAVFPLVAAVVGDGGGVLSHAAIAAREHAIPAVLGTASGTATIADGQLVRVDGTTGTVSAVEADGGNGNDGGDPSVR